MNNTILVSVLWSTNTESNKTRKITNMKVNRNTRNLANHKKINHIQMATKITKLQKKINKSNYFPKFFQSELTVPNGITMGQKETL